MTCTIYILAPNKQFKIIISYCKEAEINNAKSALKKYNFLHFLKFAIRILDINEEYNLKIEECKKYFNNPVNISISKYLYEHSEVPFVKLKEFIGRNTELPALMDELLLIKKCDNSNIYSLSPKGKNLYAFFMMKDIDIGALNKNYNESRINEILEYLIQYILTESDKDKKYIKQPILNSSSAKYNLEKLKGLIDKKDNYSQNIVQQYSREEPKSFNWIGGEPSWKKY